MSYIDSDTLDQAFDFYCQNGRSNEILTKLAERLGIEPDDLRHRWGLPMSKPSPAVDDGDDFNLFATERLDGVL